MKRKRKPSRKRRPRAWPLISNETHFQGADLRRFVKAALKAEGASERKHVVFLHTKGHWKDHPRHGIHGEASIGKDVGMGHFREGQYIRMWLPRSDTLDMERFAQVFVHEVGHNLGLRHGEMLKCSDIEVPWVEGIVVRKKEPKAKAPRDLPAEREAHARKKVAEWEKKAKSAERQLKKWRQKVRYYERRRANPPKPRPPRPKSPPKPKAPYWDDEGNLVLAIGDQLYNELDCLEVETMHDRDDPENRGEFADAWNAARRVGKRWFVTLNPGALAYLEYSLGFWTPFDDRERASASRSAARAEKEIARMKRERGAS